MAQKKASETTGTTAPPNPMEVMYQMQEAGLGPLRWLGTAWLDHCADCGAELADFVAARIKEDVKTQHALLHCKKIEEMQEIQTEFLKTALEQYTAETGKLVELASDFYGHLEKARNG